MDMCSCIQCHECVCVCVCRCSEADLATLLSQTVLEESLTYLTKCKEVAISASTDIDTGIYNDTYTTCDMMMMSW